MFMVRRGTFERSISIATVPRIQYHCIPWHDSEMWETLPVAECNDSVTFKYHSSSSNACCIVIHCYDCKNIQFDAFVPFVACGATCIDPYLIVLAHNIHRQSPGWLWAVCWCCLWFLWFQLSNNEMWFMICGNGVSIVGWQSSGGDHPV